ncbi:TBC1 domain family member 7-like [Tubulanus polymorphus]|uniref:TBC1 domain family member 7-like n=1 Tax=Tubulanus polymorphus TaxID=672921 RepID=UPI003DA46B30
MAADVSERNFRSQYYEKVGFRGVEEKKSLEILLKEQPLDLTKLCQFSLRFPVPVVYRILAWKVLLGVLPAHQEVHEFAMTQRSEQYNELLRCLQVTQVVSEHAPEPEVFLKVYLVEDGILPFDHRHLMSSPENQAFVHIATGTGEICEAKAERFWLSYKLHKHIMKSRHLFPSLIEQTDQYLKKEDKDGRIVNHLSAHRLFEKLPLDMWFRCAFANILPESSFESIWDKVIAGSFTVLAFVAVSLFLTHKRSLLSMTDSNSIVSFLQKMSVDTADAVVNRAIDMWQKQGSQLIPSTTSVSSRTDSPVIVDKSTFAILSVNKDPL